MRTHITHINCRKKISREKKRQPRFVVFALIPKAKKKESPPMSVNRVLSEHIPPGTPVDINTVVGTLVYAEMMDELQEKGLLKEASNPPPTQTSLWGTKHSSAYDRIMEDSVYFHKRSYMAIVIDNRGVLNDAITMDIDPSSPSCKNSFSYIVSDNANAVALEFIDALFDALEKDGTCSSRSPKQQKYNGDPNDLKRYNMNDLLFLYRFQTMCVSLKPTDTTTFKSMRGILLPQPYTVAYATGRTDRAATTTLLSVWNLYCMAKKTFYVSKTPAHVYSVFTLPRTYLQRVCLSAICHMGADPLAEKTCSEAGASSPADAPKLTLSHVMQNYADVKCKHIIEANKAISIVQNHLEQNSNVFVFSDEFRGADVVKTSAVIRGASSYNDSTVVLEMGVDVFMISLRCLVNNAINLYVSTGDEFM